MKRLARAVLATTFGCLTVVAAMTLVLALAGCGNGGGFRSGSGSDGLPHTLVGSDYNSVTMLETDTDDEGRITGTFDTTTLKDDSTPGPEEPVDAEHGGVTGKIDGDRVTLTIDLQWGDLTLKGTLDGITLTLRVQREDGTVEDYVLKPGTVKSYNRQAWELKNWGYAPNAS